VVEYVESNPVEEEEKEEEAGSSTHGGKGVKEESGSGRGHDGSAAAASGATPKRKERKRKAKEEEAAAKAGEANGGYMDEGGGEEDMKDALSKTEAKKARAQQKENQYDSFLKQQRLHPELAGVYAEEYMTAADAQINKHYLELKVFRGDHAVPDAIAGIVQVEPHTTFRDVRLLLQEELGFDCEVGEELVLSRTTYSEGGGDGGNGGNGGGGEGDAWRKLLCPIPLTQNHKLVAPYFPRPTDVLMVKPNDRKLPPEILKEVNKRALPREKILMVDVSRGHEKQPIPVYNGADDEPAPNDFTYVTECVASEGLRLLLGGPSRDAWTCPFLESGGRALTRAEQPAYTQSKDGPIFLHPPHTIHSVYECSLGKI